MAAAGTNVDRENAKDEKPRVPVRLVDGLFTDYQGVLEWIADDRRVSVHLSMLGRQVRVSVPAASVAVA